MYLSILKKSVVVSLGSFVILGSTHAIAQDEVTSTSLASETTQSQAHSCGTKTILNRSGLFNAQSDLSSLSAASATPQNVQDFEFNDSNGSFTLDNFGAGSDQVNRAKIEGIIRFSPLPTLLEEEGENGSIPTATPLNIESGQAVLLDGSIGGGPFGGTGTGSGDFDFYALGELQAGQKVQFQVDFDEDTNFGYAFELYNAQGESLSLFQTFEDAAFQTIIEEAGEYYIALTDLFSDIGPQDPFDPASGNGQLLDPSDLNEGDYSLVVGLDYANRGLVNFTAQKGEVITIGATPDIDGTNLTLFDSNGDLVQGSFGPLFEPSDLAPSSPGDLEISYLVPETGEFSVGLFTFDSTDVDYNIVASIPPLASPSNISQTQIIFLDFDGVEDLDLAQFRDFNLPESELRDYQGLEASLELFNLDASRGDEFIDAIIADVQRRLVDEIAASGINPDFDIQIRNSRDHGDLWMEPNVTRVVFVGDVVENDPIIGGSLRGIAESIDVGNFDRQETTLVYLANIADGFTRLFLAPDRELEAWSKEVGFITAHEIGHLLGAEHLFDDQEVTPIMIADVSFAIRRGDDGLFGTDDDVDAQFTSGNILSNLRFGTQDTVALIALPNSSGEKRVDLGELAPKFAPLIDRITRRLNRIDEVALRLAEFDVGFAERYKTRSVEMLIRFSSFSAEVLARRSAGMYSQAAIDQALSAFNVRLAAATSHSL